MSGSLREELERSWPVLGLPAPGRYESIPLEQIMFRGKPCRLALDNSGSRHFLVPCLDEQPKSDTNPAVLTAAVWPLSFKGEPASPHFDVACTDTGLFPEFDDLILDVIDNIRCSAAPATEASAVLQKWRRLFQSRSSRVLSHEAKIGLYAELRVLSALAQADTNFAVDAWRGPLREPHDFELGSRCIEVKAIGQEATCITVHGWKQLETHNACPLDLIVVTVVGDDSGETIGELIQSLPDRIRMDPTFKTRLSAAEYSPSYAALDDESFSCGPIFVVHVDDQLPRLTRAMVANSGSIPDLRYDVELESVVPLAFAGSIAAVAAG